MKTIGELLRRALFLAMAIVLIGLAADDSLAQRGVRFDSNTNVDRSMFYLTRQLDLTEAQQDQIRPIMQAHMDRRQEFFANSERGIGIPLGSRPEMQELREETHAKVNTILNDAQREKYSELQQSPGFMRGFDRPMRGPRGRGVRR